ncbi:ABC transporter ATP-binding protein [Rhodovulum sulfidophilum]|uniref:Ribose import ATP-binding protein n=1 Tax=Rhodovulum sulfidophilum TaxID=35806 RepID=A0A0D6B5M1_RHOSU|nr:ABC transporter ATP-binding protein [Rhodovulum sulfidophilum]MBL3551352.1 ABC transporter ATP-binding protein [Rhodovulum sulfidophilum]MBL3575029.1 ABC transporter ATP-binding protein [Rhodovulum sulfidophilum]MBL3596473.1 ABC transporter ATP-binding protein [Rhodovulum sulfidophilum]MCE8430608.1 ABC transporter ATP-binding protein [Rhodovulum sulfidophilum]MCF4117814.1 ABC transporter ATP-binding protein [Rhodovulum sulfidophilum]
MSGNRPVVLKLEGITKSFGALRANDNIGFALHRGEVLALLGENGAGKTTLMNILFGHYTADAGTVEVMGQALPPGQPGAALAAGVGMVHQHFTLAGNLTVTENILLGTRPLWRAGLGRSAARARIAALSRDFGLAVRPDAKVRDLSVGERQRVEILKALYREARVLILDEPTAVLTPQETDALLATLRKAVARGLSVIFISHKLHEVMAAADRVIVLRHGRVAGEVATAETDRHRLAEMMVGEEVRLPQPSTATPGPALMSLRQVTCHPEGSRSGLNRVTFDLRAGQITGLAGVSGNGQGALADLVSGMTAPDEGRLEVHGAEVSVWSPRAALAAGVGRIPEDRHATGSIADFTLTENAVLEDYARPPYSRHGWMNWRAARTHAEKIIAAYDLRCPGPEARIRLLSGGNMQKLILGRALEAGPRIILANQPVRGLDIGALTYVQECLIAARDAGAAILLISEDLDEVLALSDVIHVMSEGRLSPGFPRGSKTPAELGAWMAGQGFDHAA